MLDKADARNGLTGKAAEAIGHTGLAANACHAAMHMTKAI